MFEDIFPVVLTMLVCIPLAIVLIQSLFHENEVENLKQRVDRAEELLGALLGIVEPRQLADADLPPDVVAGGGDND